MLDVEFLMVVGEVRGGLSPPFSTGFPFVLCIPEVSPLRGYTSGYESCALSGSKIPLGLRLAYVWFASGGAVSRAEKPPVGGGSQ